MKFKAFKKNASGAPWDLYEFAEEASTVTDNPGLKRTAEAYLAAKQEFEETLEANEIEMG